MNTKSKIKKIAQLANEQPWIYRFKLSDKVYTPGPTIKGTKNMLKTKVIQTMNLKSKKVLDIGSAEGLFSFYLSEAGASVIGLEKNSKRIRKANFIKLALGLKNVEFMKFDIENALEWKKLKGKYYAIFCFSVIHRVADPINLIANMASKSDILILEFKSPEGFIHKNLSVAFHETYGVLDPRNIKNSKFGKGKEGISDSGFEKPYWTPSVGAVKAICSAFGFKTFQEFDASKFSLKRVVYSYIELIFNLAFRNKQPYMWRRYRRVILICYRDDRVKLKRLSPINRMPWDGTIG